VQDAFGAVMRDTRTPKHHVTQLSDPLASPTIIGYLVIGLTLSIHF
jgi:hypothetical protein